MISSNQENQTNITMKPILDRALIYLRVSTDKQAEKGIAIPTQQDRCFEYARENGLDFDTETDIYIDRGESARSMDRPALADMLNRCQTDRSVKAIIVYDVSRLARNRIDFAIIKQSLEKKKIKLISATEPINDTPEGQILEGVLSSVAEFFSTQNARKVRANMIKKAKDGYWPTRAPYGYKNVQEKVATGKVRAWVEVNWEEAKWVTRTFELFATGEYSTKSLAKKLAEEGFPVRNYRNGKGKLHSSFVERILREKFYAGILEWGGITVAPPVSKHELFLDPALFNKVQIILDARNAGASRHRRLFSVLKAVSYCAECGSKMTVEEATTSSGRVIQYLRCLKQQKNEKVDCKQKFYHEEEYIKQFKKILQKVELPDAFVEKLRVKVKTLFADEQAIYEAARKDILSKIENNQRRKKNLILQFIDRDNPSMSDEMIYDSVKHELEVEEERLNQDLARTKSKIAGVARTVEIALALAVSVSHAFDRATEPELRALLARTIFKKLYYRDGKIVSATLNEPLDYLLCKKLKRYPVFDLASVSGPRENRTPASAMRMPRNTTLLWAPIYSVETILPHLCVFVNIVVQSAPCKPSF